MERELARQAASSPWNGRAHHLLGVFALMDGRPDLARVHLEKALERRPLLPRVHEMLGMIALDQDRPRDAVREFGRERALHGARRGLDLRLGAAWHRLGDAPRARAAWQRAAEADPDDRAARDSLAALDAVR